jgi:nitroimidazol reductase NimA-like FMN-containing flavoprotein (pyridoxamine 5'-phosphate oxidase superfamily)
MQREEREITDVTAIEALLSEGVYATLAFARGSEPYLATLNYGYDAANRVLYFHSANAGLKLDFMRENSQVCGTVVKDRGYRQGQCEPAYSSVVFRGHVEFLETEAAKRLALGCMVDQTEDDPASVRGRLLAEGRHFAGITVFKVTIEEMTGKTAH